MFNFEVIEAEKRRQDGIRMRRLLSGYYVPDRIVDRNALKLARIAYVWTKDPNDVGRQLAGEWIEFID